MNHKDYSEVQRLLGVIEGASFFTKDPVQGLLIDTVALINKILDRNNEKEALGEAE